MISSAIDLSQGVSPPLLAGKGPDTLKSGPPIHPAKSAPPILPVCSAAGLAGMFKHFYLSDWKGGVPSLHLSCAKSKKSKSKNLGKPNKK